MFTRSRECVGVGVPRLIGIFLGVLIVTTPIPTLAAAPSITFGAAVQFDAQVTGRFAPGKIDASHFILAYSSTGDNIGVAAIGTLSGNSVTFGSAFVFADNGADAIDLAMIDATHALIMYSDMGNDRHGTAVVATISGNSITYGAPEEFETNGIENNSSFTYLNMLDATHFVIAYPTRDDGLHTDPPAYVIAGTVSGTDLTFGSPVQYGERIGFQQIAPLDSTHFIVSYPATTNNVVIGTVSGTSISLGTPVLASTASASQNSITVLDSTHIIVGFQNGDEDSADTLIGGIVSGSSVTFGTPITMPGVTENSLSFAPLDATHAAFVYQEFSDSGHGKGVIITMDGTTLTRSEVAVFFDVGSAMYNRIIAMDEDTVLVFTADQGAGYEGYYTVGTYVIPSVASSSSSSSSSSSEAPHQSSGGSRGGSTEHVVTLLKKRAMKSDWMHSADETPATQPPETMALPLQKRTCDRVMKWFRNDAKMLERVNVRLEKRFGFRCSE
jgi:hypothetical protein